MGLFDRAPKAKTRSQRIREKQCNHVHVSLLARTLGSYRHCEHYCPNCGETYRCGKGE